MRFISSSSSSSFNVYNGGGIRIRMCFACFTDTVGNRIDCCVMLRLV